MRLLGGDGPFADTCAAQITILAQRRTTVLPAALLGLAASGHVCAEMAGLLLCALADGWPPLGSAIVWLCAAGHTCGADLTRGVYIGGWALTWPAPARAVIRLIGWPRLSPEDSMPHTLLVSLYSAVGLVCIGVLCLPPLLRAGSWRLRLYTGSLTAVFTGETAAIAAYWATLS